MSDAPELAFSEEELTLLARLAGAPYFPGTRLVDLDEEGWLAVARGLVARGVLTADDPPAVAGEVDAVLGVVLRADRSLRMTLVHAAGEGDNGGEVLWLAGSSLVRHVPSWDGVHRFGACDHEAVDELLAAALDIREVDSQAGPSQTLGGQDFTRALELNASDGASAVADTFPAVTGYVEALQDARRMTHVTSQRRFEDFEPEGELTLVESPRHGLWVQREEPADDTVVVQRVTVEGAREVVAAVVGTFG